VHAAFYEDFGVEISVSDAKAQLTDLVRRAEAGEEIVLIRHGHPAVRLVPVKVATTAESRRAVMDAVRASAAAKAEAGKLLPGPSAARSQDFLYDEDGLPAWLRSIRPHSWPSR
jgi:prevent-host-death family protein